MEVLALVLLALPLASGCDGVVHGPRGADQLLEGDRARSPNNPRLGRGDARRTGPTRRDRGDHAVRYPEDLRSLDGTGNHPTHPDWGRAGGLFRRAVPAAYADGAHAPSGEDRPGAREISQAALAQTEDAANARGASDLLWQWGQFLDHDLDLAPEVDPEEAFDIAVPTGDPAFDPEGSGRVFLGLHRSLYETVRGVREHVNAITSYIDASNVYGSDARRASGLRVGDGSGRLRTSEGNMLPFNTTGLDNAAPPGMDAASLFVAGDFRANEQVGLAVLHTLFVREHNRLVAMLATEDPAAEGDELYERARALVGAEMQAITYNEFLPVLLGPDALPSYEGYDEDLEPDIANVFATAAYRVGHTMLSANLLRLSSSGQDIEEGPLALAEAFFRPEAVLRIGLEPYLRGLATQQARAVDLQVVDDVRHFLFGPPGAGGLDLASLNVQRGRDHGLPDFNSVREAHGLRAWRSFAELNPDPEVQARLEAAYESIDQLDAWVGGLAEPPVPGGMVGETLVAVLGDQFWRLREGDRFWYERYLPAEERAWVDASTLAAIIRRNTDVGSELQDDVFLAP
ncbi:MAG: peroxidase family protein [Myxococcota bacterium]